MSQAGHLAPCTPRLAPRAAASREGPDGRSRIISGQVTAEPTGVPPRAVSSAELRRRWGDLLPGGGRRTAMFAPPAGRWAGRSRFIDH